MTPQVLDENRRTVRYIFRPKEGNAVAGFDSLY